MRCVKRRNWDRSQATPWLGEGDVPADPFGDLATMENTLSVWLVEDNKSNLKRLVTALAANRERPDKFDYLLFDQKILSKVNIVIRDSEGKTLDDQVNLFHRDLVEISGRKLLALVEEILSSDFETDRFLPKEILLLVTQAVTSGQIDRWKLKKSFQEKITVTEGNVDHI